ncbi:MAG: cytochrome c biogenesis protein CcsA, partial [Planctomycetota bacterium]
MSRSVFRAVGSLWFAAVLLILLLVAMACATVVESTSGPLGTELALDQFYQAWWFEALLALVALNVLAAALLRYPFSKRHIGFVVTHAGILVTLGGALVTKHFGVDGRIGLAEGDTAESFN